MALLPTDNGSIVIGYMMNYTASGVDLWITGLNSSGAIAWSYALHQSSHTYGQGVARRANGAFMVTGHVDKEDHLDMFIAVFAPNGSLQTWHLLDEKEDTQGLVVTSYDASHPSMLGATYANASNKGGIFMLQWHPNETFWMRRWDHREQVQPHDITSYDQARLIVATQQANDASYAQLLLLKSSTHLSDDCGMTSILYLNNLAHNLTQKEVFLMLFFPDYTSDEVDLVKVPFNFSEVIQCEVQESVPTTTPSSTWHPTKKCTQERFHGFGSDRRPLAQDALIVLGGFMVYAITVPMINTVWEGYKAKKARDRQKEEPIYLFKKGKTIGPIRDATSSY